jgi:aspartate ammonia-lyase
MSNISLLTNERDMVYRIEADKLGEKNVETSKYYGISVVRSLENFPNRCESIGADEHYVPSIAEIKKAFARANHKAGLIRKQQLEAIEYACGRCCATRARGETAPCPAALMPRG